MTPLSTLRRLTDLADARLHPRRRAAALLAAGRGAGGPVLVICTGNIYRSPFAAAVLARRGVHATSAGLLGAERPCPPEAVHAAAARGVDLAGHRSRLVLAPMVHGAGLIVVMEPRQRSILLQRFGLDAGRVLLLGDLDPDAIRSRVVVDPWRGDPGVVEVCYDRIERCVAALAGVLLPG